MNVLLLGDDGGFPLLLDGLLFSVRFLENTTMGKSRADCLRDSAGG